MHPVTEFVLSRLQALGDKAKAVPMQVYMKTSQPFFGVQAQDRKQILRELIQRKSEFAQGEVFATIDEYQLVVSQLWQEEHRESQYMAILVAERFRRFRVKESMPLFQWMVANCHWWDTLDPVATNLVGQLVHTHREFERDLCQWRTSPHLWTRRASLLAHLKHRSDLNTPLVSETILLLAPETNFFIRKAIGWLLREASKLHPDWVETFVSEHKDKLSGLSCREAMKHITNNKQQVAS